MNIYFCKREEDYYKGGLVIQAESKEKAEEIFKDREDCDPFSTTLISLNGKGVLYNHDQ